MGNSGKFWDRIATRYFNQPLSDPEAYHQKISMIKEILTEDMDVLEIGCGTGSTAVSLAPLARSFHCVDISANMLAYGRQQAEDLGLSDISFERADLETYAPEAGAFDFVLAMSIVHLLKDPEAVIQNMYRTLKPGGYMAINTMCLGEGPFFLKLIAPIGRFFGFMPYLNFFTKKQLRQSLADIGFRIENEWKSNKNNSIFVIIRK